MSNKETMVIYESAYKAINYLPTVEMKWEAIEGLLKYGFYNVEPESDNPYINMVYTQAIPSMRSAKKRYDIAVENGKKGGRPTEITTEEIMNMKKQGMTNKEIADKLNCSVKNIENRITTWNKSHTNPNNPNNLSVSVSVSESEYVSESESISESDESEREIAYAKEEREERDLDSLDTEVLREILKKFENKEKYTVLRNEYNLKKDDTNKELGKKIKDIIHSREYKEAQAKAFENTAFPEVRKPTEFKSKGYDSKSSNKFKNLW